MLRARLDGLLAAEHHRPNVSVKRPIMHLLGLIERGSRLLAPSEKDFEKFISLLDNAQGNVLRAFSNGVAPIVKGVLRGTLGELDVFPLERADQDQILRLPKGSPALLSLIT